MTVTRSEALRRPSRRRSQDVTPSRSARSRGARPSSASQASTSDGAQADARGAMDMRASLPEEAPDPAQASLAVTRGGVAGARPPATSRPRRRASVAAGEELVGPGVGRPRAVLDRPARADLARGKVGRAALLTHLHVAPEPRAAR